MEIAAESQLPPLPILQNVQDEKLDATGLQAREQIFDKTQNETQDQIQAAKTLEHFHKVSEPESEPELRQESQPKPQPEPRPETEPEPISQNDQHRQYLQHLEQLSVLDEIQDPQQTQEALPNLDFVTLGMFIIGRLALLSLSSYLADRFFKMISTSSPQ